MTKSAPAAKKGHKSSKSGDQRTPQQKAAAREWAERHVSDLTRRIDEKLQALSDTLKSGFSEEFLSYLKAMSHFHRYSPANTMLILMQAPQGVRQVAGLKTWRTYGRTVKKGAKAIHILRPILGPDFRITDEHGEHPLVIKGFSYVPVFADTDTEGQPLPELPQVQGNEDTHAALLGWFERARANGIPVVYEVCPIGWYGYSDGGKIVMDSVKCAGQAGISARTFFHEWAHHLLHWKAERVPADQRPSKNVREVEADATAYALCALHGIDAAAQVSDYIQAWGGDADTLKGSLNRIRETVQHIMQALYPAQGAAGAEAEDAPAVPLAA